MWELRSGSREWLAVLSSSSVGSYLVEFDVNDCFLNCSQEFVLPALLFWMDELCRFSRSRDYAFHMSRGSRKLELGWKVVLSPFQAHVG